ncbi:Uncharacterized protein GNX_3930 [Leptospira interrogans serovar Canicola]|nr:Uncharacterized protein GNX_3930 [Leptospira interrogans serovar Canicola]
MIFLWFGALAVAGNAERVAGNSFAQSATNDPAFLTLVSFLCAFTGIDLFSSAKRWR